MDIQAEELNKGIANKNPDLLNLLSEKGKAIFFPKLGILAQSKDAGGKAINATIGIAIEDDGTPMRLSTIADKISIKPNLAFPYAPSYGREDFRKEWQKLLFEKNPSLKGKEVSLSIATCGLTHGLYVAGYLFINPGDTIIMPDLYWENYGLVFSHAFGAEFANYPLFQGGGFNLDGFKSALKAGSSKKKIVLLNFPNNPTGYTPTKKEAEQIVGILKASVEEGNSLVVLIDDAYFGLFYEEETAKESIFASLSDMSEKLLAVKLDGPTKEEYVWGFRAGCITFGIKGGNRELYSLLEAKAAGAVRGSISNISNLSQSLIVGSMIDPAYSSQKAEKFGILKSRYLEVKRVLKAHPEYSKYFSSLPYNSGYFMCVKTVEGLSTEKIRQRLLEKYDTGVIANGSIIRLAFSAVRQDKIETLFSNLYSACKDVSSG